MIHIADDLLRTLFLTELSADLPAAANVRLGPPDDDHVSSVNALIDELVLSIYLIDIRENRALRSNEVSMRRNAAGALLATSAPVRLDCHYLITAWKKPSTDIDPTPEEHRLLAQVAAVLVRARVLNPTRIYGAGASELDAIPPSSRDADLPLIVSPSEGFPKLGEFWTTMGPKLHWRPGIYAVVTVPVQYAQDVVDGIVETILFDTGEERTVVIGGEVRDDTVVGPPVSVPGAIVVLERVGVGVVDRTFTDSDGHFRIGGLAPGSYRISWSAPNLASPPTSPRTIDVPSAGGHYQLGFT